MFLSASAKWGVPAPILEGIARTESSLRSYVDAGGVDGVGLMGMTMATAGDLGYTGDREGLKDPAVNIDLGAHYAANIIKSQGGLFLPDFYSQYNSGRSALWRTSSQVSLHVRNFLVNVGLALGIQLPADVTIDSALATLGEISLTETSGLFVILALLFLFRRKL